MKDSRLDLIDEIECVLVRTMPETFVENTKSEIFKLLRNYEVYAMLEESSISYEEKNTKTVDRYFRACGIENKTERTIKEYKRVIKNFANFIQKDLTKTKPYDVMDYLGTLKENGNDGVTVRNNKNVLSAFFLFLEGEESIEKNPMRSIRKIKVDEKVKLPFTDLDVEAIRNACRGIRDRAMVEILLSSGIRCSELLDLKVADLDTSTLQLRIVKGKGNKDRIVFISKVANKYLQDYLNQRKCDSEYMFASLKGYSGNQLKISGVEKIIRTIGKRAGVENCHPHRFRRTFATNCIKRGMPLQELQKLLGHTDIKVTMKYVFVENGTLKGSYEKYS